MYTVLLSGGSGKRLWPLSNDFFSKQYIKLVRDAKDGRQICSMIQRVWGQLEQIGLSENIAVAANSAQVEIIKGQISDAVPIAVEPERRDTFPAVVLSCAFLKSVMNALEEDYVLVMPVDPFAGREFFGCLPKIQQVLQRTGAPIGLIGAKPTYPSEKYGYIVPRARREGYLEVEGFTEKPDLETAQGLLDRGALWNCGVFCFRLGLAREYCEKYGLPFDYETIRARYAELPKNSFDYEVLEKAEELAAVEFEGTWKDLGTWNTLTEEMSDPAVGKVQIDSTCTNTHVINTLDIPIIAMGTHDLVVAASNDGILVSDKYTSSFLKDCLKDYDASPRYEERRWGSIKTVDVFEEERQSAVTKRVKLLAGKNTSYHSHKTQNIVLIVISGEGELVVNGVRSVLRQGDSAQIHKNDFYAVRAVTGLRFFEILTGVSREDEVRRAEYDWGKILKECEVQ